MEKKTNLGLSGGNAMEKKTGQNLSVGKVLLLIEVLAAGMGPMRLRDIATAAGMPESTALRLLGALQAGGYARQVPETGRYALTLRFSRIGEAVRAQSGIREIVRPHLDALARSVGESACLAIEEDMAVVYLDAVEGPDNLLRTLQRIGRTAPLHSTGVGKVLMSEWPQEKVAEMIARKGLPAMTRHTVTDPVRFLQVLAHVRKAGVAPDDEECETGVRCLAAPLRDDTGAVVAAISVSVPSSRMTPDLVRRIRAEVVRTAHEISRDLGHTPARNLNGVDRNPS